MSWRRFQVLYHGLTPYGAVASNYDAAKKRAALDGVHTEADAWGVLTSLSKPKGVDGDGAGRRDA